jgi:ssDNA-binding Zn-finger/Zn-ribbon topoisomerase 1
VEARLYGPCSACVEELRIRFAATGARDVVAPDYVPKVNVTANAVALKDE